MRFALKIANNTDFAENFLINVYNAARLPNNNSGGN